MTNFNINPLRRNQAIIRIEQRFTRFKEGARERLPDFSEFRRKVAAFFERVFGKDNPKPNGIDMRRPQVAAPAESPRDRDPDLAALEEPFFRRRISVSEATMETNTAAGPTVASEPVITERENNAETDIVNRIKNTAFEVGDAIGQAADKIVKGVEAVSEVVQETATAMARSAEEALARTADRLTGSPPPPESNIPILTKEERPKAEDSIEPPETPPIGSAKREEPKPPQVEHRQPAIERWDDKPKPEQKLYDGKAERAREKMQKKTDGESAPEPPHVAPFTEEEERNATISARRIEEELKTEALKQQEEEIARQNNEAANKRQQKAEPPPRPRFDPSQAKKFENWGDPTGDAAHPQTVVEQSAEQKTESRKRAASIATGTKSTIRTDTDDPVPQKRRLQRRARVADLRKQRRQTEEFHKKLRQLSEDAAARPPRRNPALKLALTEGTQTSTKPASKRLHASPLRPDIAPSRRVRFGYFVGGREIEISAEERAIDAEAILKTEHKDMRPRLVEGDRFIGLMLIALDDTELPSNRDPHKMAIELYRAFSKKAPDRWAEQAESTIRQQLEARPRADALRALEPIVKYFDRYSGPPSKNERPGEQFLHQRLGQLGMILQKLQNEQASRTD